MREKSISQGLFQEEVADFFADVVIESKIIKKEHNYSSR